MEGSKRRKMRRWTVAALCVTAFALWASAADAALVFDTKWGSQGPGAGQFDMPKGVGGGVSDDVYVADTGNNRIERFTSGGTFITSWGGSGTASGRFNTPGAVAVDFAGNVYVADIGNNRIQKFDGDGVFLEQIGGFGSGNGQFQNPYGVAIDAIGNIYVADTGNNRVQKLSPAGAFIAQWGGSGTISGTFNSPVDTAVDFAGNVYVTDFGNNRIQKFDSSGAFITMWGTIGSAPGNLWGPYGIDVDSGGDVYASEAANNHRIQRFTSSGAFLEQAGAQGSGDGQYQTPTGVSLDSFDAVYVTDTFNHRVQRYESQRSAIVIREDSVPDDPRNFDYTAGGGLTPASFQLDDDGNTANGDSNVRTFIVDPGSGYSLSQDATPTGWDLASATCSDGSSPSNIDVAEDEVVTCTFTNNRRAGLFVVQDSLPDDPQDFEYTAGGGLSPSSFQLDDDGDDSNALASVRSFENLPPGSGYTVAQGATPPGWSDADASCSDGSPVTNVDLGVGETVVCTFSNVSPTAGRVVVVTDAQPDDPQDFSFTAGGGLSPTTFALDDDGESGNALSDRRTFIVAPGSGYSVAETVPGGWLLDSATCSDGSPVSNIDVGPAETVTCTFTNQRPGTITLTKDSVPDDPQDFDFTAGGGLSPSSFQLDDDGAAGALSNTRTFSGVEPGAGYSVTETVPAGWEQQSATCSDGSPLTNIDVAPNETIQCTITNRKLATLVVDMDAQPDDPQDFDFTAGGGLTPAAFQLDDDGNETNALASTRTFVDVVPGTYSVTQTPVAGWQQLTPTCSDGSPAASIALSAGETATCSFTAQRKGRITVRQDTLPDGPQDFGYTTSGLSPSTFQLDDDGDDFNALASTRVFDDVVPAGSGYSVAQDPLAGWLLDSSTCSDGSSPGDIHVSPGEQITCTFTNSERGRIIVIKNAQPNSSVDFAFTAGGGLSPTSFSLDDDGDEANALASSRAFLVSPGAGYSVSENPPPAGWTLESATCSDGSAVSNIDAAAGETVTCVFVNAGQIGNYVRPKGATPLKASLVPAYTQCTAPNRTHGPPLASPSCNPPVQAGPSITIGTPDANGSAANFEGSVRYRVLFAPGGVDDTDVQITAGLTDVRCRAGTAACGSANAADGADYTGEVRATVALTITDPLSESESATTTEIPFGMTFPCVSSALTSIGGQCAIDTTADSLVPGSAPEGRRSVWQFGQVQVLDGGPDGLVSTGAGNALFLTQGVFIP